MPRHSETRHLPYTPDQMFDLVADVGRYDEFLPWVSAVRVQSDTETEMVADMVVGFKSLRERFTSRVEKSRPNRIVVHYVDGPMRNLDNSWQISATEDGGSEVDFCVDFTFKNRVFEAMAGQYVDRAFRKLMGAFEARAEELYGSSNSSAQTVA